MEIDEKALKEWYSEGSPTVHERLASAYELIEKLQAESHEYRSRAEAATLALRGTEKELNDAKAHQEQRENLYMTRIMAWSEKVEELEAALATARQERDDYKTALSQQTNAYLDYAATARDQLSAMELTHFDALGVVRAVAMEEAARECTFEAQRGQLRTYAERIRALAPLPAGLVVVPVELTEMLAALVNNTNADTDAGSLARQAWELLRDGKDSGYEKRFARVPVEVLEQAIRKIRDLSSKLNDEQNVTDTLNNHTGKILDALEALKETKR